MNDDTGNSEKYGTDTSQERKRDECPECGCVGQYIGESTMGGPSVGLGAPRYIEHYRCMAENCDKEWTA